MGHRPEQLASKKGKWHERGSVVLGMGLGMAALGSLALVSSLGVKEAEHPQNNPYHTPRGTARPITDASVVCHGFRSIHRAGHRLELRPNVVINGVPASDFDEYGYKPYGAYAQNNIATFVKFDTPGNDPRQAHEVGISGVPIPRNGHLIEGHLLLSDGVTKPC